MSPKAARTDSIEHPEKQDILPTTVMSKRQHEIRTLLLVDTHASRIVECGNFELTKTYEHSQQSWYELYGQPFAIWKLNERSC